MLVLAIIAAVVVYAGGFLTAALLTANPMSEMRDENHELRRRLSECTCREGA